MGSIGIRAKPEEIIFAIYKNDDVFIDSILLPDFLKNEEKLSYLRNALNDIFNEFQIKNGALKVMEGNIRSVNNGVFRRIENETIIKEILYSSGIENYKMLKNSNFSSLLSEEKSIVTELIKGSRKEKSKFSEEYFSKELKKFEIKVTALKGIRNEQEREAIVSAFISNNKDIK